MIKLGTSTQSASRLRNRIAAMAIVLALIPAMGQNIAPDRFLRTEALGLGWFAQTEGWGGMSIRLADLDLEYGRLRAGASLLNTCWVIDDWETDMLVPVHAGFSIFEKPKRTWAWCSFVPDIYLEAGGSLWNGNGNNPFSFQYEPTARLAICCDVDYYGLGAGIEAGWMNVDTETELYGRMSLWYAGVRLRVLALGFGF